MDVVYLGFATAFDNVDFNIVLQQLHNLGVVGELFCWIRSFLVGRRQCVWLCAKYAVDANLFRLEFPILTQEK